MASAASVVTAAVLIVYTGIAAVAGLMEAGAARFGFDWGRGVGYPGA
jgi:hypothetical protein